MNRYWLSQDEQMSGPFAEGVILDMWRRGQVVANAQVCLEGMQDWMDAKFLINEMEIAKERKMKAGAHREQDLAAQQQQARSRYRREEKSRIGAFVLNLFLPGLGQVYCGQWGQALVVFVFAFGMLIFAVSSGLFPLLGLANILAGLSGSEVAKKYNNRLADELGV